MKKLNKAGVSRLASLANLKLTPGEIKKFQLELGNIFEFISIIKQTKTNGVNPTFQPGENKNIARKDRPKKSLSLKLALRNANQTKNGYIKTSKISSHER